MLAIMNKDVPLLIAAVLLSNAGRLDISQPYTVSIAHNSSQNTLTLWSLPPLRVFASDIAVLFLELVQFPCVVQHCRTHLECGV